jgi:hypothetical protein
LLETGVSRGKIAWRDGRYSQRSASSILAPQRVPDREKTVLRDDGSLARRLNARS